VLVKIKGSQRRHLHAQRIDHRGRFGSDCAPGCRLA
jgi:hypothetical protein